MLKRILFFDHTAKLGGGEIALLQMLECLNRQEFFPVVVLAAEGPLVGMLREAGIETHVLPLAAEIGEVRKDSLGGGSLLRIRQAALALRYCFELAGFIRRARIDLVHTNSLKADLLGGVASRLARVPVLWHVRDRIDTDYLPKPVVLVFRKLCRWLPKAIVANSRATLGTLKLPAGKGFVVHDGIPAGFVPGGEKAPGPPLIALVGRITEWKGQHIFIEAAARVHALFPEARFQIIGSAMFGEEEYERKIRAMVANRGLEECFEFTGFRTDVPKLIEALDILVHASITGEPFGQVVIEGMAAAKPVVATNGGGVPEIVCDGETGLLVPMGDAAAMASAIGELLSNPADGLAMGRAGRQRVLDHFTAHHTAGKMEGIYRQILDIAPPDSAFTA